MIQVAAHKRRTLMGTCRDTTNQLVHIKTKIISHRKEIIAEVTVVQATILNLV